MLRVMKQAQRIFLAGLGAIALLFAGCARAEPEINRNMPDNAQPIVVPPVSSGANANANLNANTPAFPTEATNATTVTELQDSVITSTNDNVGNRIETRVFRAHPRLSQIVVITGKNKHKSGRIYGNRGEVKEIPASLIQNALILNGDELADAVGIALDKSPKRNAPQLPALEKPTPTPTATPKPVASPTPKPKTVETPPEVPEPDQTVIGRNVAVGSRQQEAAFR